MNEINTILDYGEDYGEKIKFGDGELYGNGKGDGELFVFTFSNEDVGIQTGYDSVESSYDFLTTI